MFNGLHGLEIQPITIEGVAVYVIATALWTFIIWRIRRWAKNRQKNQELEEKE